MKNYFLLITTIILLIPGCKKSESISSDSPSVSGQTENGKGNGNGGNTNTGFLLNLFPGNVRVISGQPSYIFVSFTEAAPAAGWVLQVSSNNQHFQVPATVNITAGSLNYQIPVTTTVVPNTEDVSFSVTLGAQTKTNVCKIYPPTAILPAPQLLKPSNGRKFRFGSNITYDWNDHLNAYYSQMQLCPDITFTGPLLTEFANFESFFFTNFVPSTGVLFWRARFFDASDTAGPWSEIRSLEIRPQ